MPILPIPTRADPRVLAFSVRKINCKHASMPGQLKKLLTHAKASVGEGLFLSIVALTVRFVDQPSNLILSLNAIGHCITMYSKFRSGGWQLYKKLVILQENGLSHLQLSIARWKFSRIRRGGYLSCFFYYYLFPFTKLLYNLFGEYFFHITWGWNDKLRDT